MATETKKTPYCIVRTDLIPEVVVWLANRDAGYIGKIFCYQHDDGSVELEVTTVTGEKRVIQVSGPVILKADKRV